MCGMNFQASLAFLDASNSSVKVYKMNCSYIITLKSYFIILAQRRLLVRKTVVINKTLFFLLSFMSIDQARQCIFFFEQLFISEILQPKHFPPKRFLLSPVPIKHVCQQPLRLLFSTSPFFFKRNIANKSIKEWLNALLMLCDIFRGFTSTFRGPRNNFSLVYQIGSSCLQ